MPKHWTPEDKRRTLPVRQRLLDRLAPKDDYPEGPWVDMDKVAEAIGARVGTCLSKMRELNDYHHAHLGLEFQSRHLGGGRWEYRVVRRVPEQMPLLEAVHA